MVSKIVRSDLKVPGGNQKLAFLLDIVFSKEECEELGKGVRKSAFKFWRRETNSPTFKRKPENQTDV